jgi:hypothetical protein
VSHHGDAWESLQPCTLTEGSGSVRLDPPSSRKPPDHLGTAGRCGTEFLDGFFGLGSGSRRPSRKDQFADSASRGAVERVGGSGSRLRVPLRHGGTRRRSSSQTSLLTNLTPLPARVGCRVSVHGCRDSHASPGSARAPRVRPGQQHEATRRGSQPPPPSAPRGRPCPATLVQPPKGSCRAHPSRQKCSLSRWTCMSNAQMFAGSEPVAEFERELSRVKI